MRVLLELVAGCQCTEAVHDVLTVRDEVDHAGALGQGHCSSHDLARAGCLVFTGDWSRGIHALPPRPVDAETGSGAGYPIWIAAAIGVDLDGFEARVESAGGRKQLLDPLAHLRAGGPLQEAFGDHAAVPERLWPRSGAPLARLLLFRRRVVDREDAAGLRVGVVADALAVVVEVVRVREGLVAVGAMMVASMFQIALPRRVCAVRENRADAATQPRCFCKFEEFERFVNVDPSTKIKKVVSVSVACLAPGAVSASNQNGVC